MPTTPPGDTKILAIPAHAGYRRTPGSEQQAVWSISYFQWPQRWELYLAEDGTWPNEWEDIEGVQHTASTSGVNLFDTWPELKQYLGERIPEAGIAGAAIAAPTPQPGLVDFYFFAGEAYVRLTAQGSKPTRIDTGQLNALFPWRRKNPFPITAAANLYVPATTSKWVALFNGSSYVTCQHGASTAPAPQRTLTKIGRTDTAFGFIGAPTAKTDARPSRVFILGTPGPLPTASRPTAPQSAAPTGRPEFDYLATTAPLPLKTSTTLTEETIHHYPDSPRSHSSPEN